MQQTSSRCNSGRRGRIALPITMIAFVLMATSLASAYQPWNGSLTSVAVSRDGGFWIQVDSETAANVGTIAVGGAPQYDSVPERGSIAGIPGLNGYWVVTPSGRIHARGGAPSLCGGDLTTCSGFNTSGGKFIVAVAASPNAKGFWAVDNARHVWTAGDVVSYGDVTNDNRTPTGIAVTPSGHGYYIVMHDGGVHARGDAVFFGSTGGNRPGGFDLVGIALSYDIMGDVNGYWLVSSDGGIHTFGDAPFLGSSGGAPGANSVASMASRPDGTYVWAFNEGELGYSAGPAPLTLKSVARDRVIGVAGGGSEPVTPLQLESFNGSPSQKWRAVPAVPKVEGAFRLVNEASGLCMDLEGNHPSGRVVQYPCKAPLQGWTNQLWIPMKDQSGQIQFKVFSQPDFRLYGYPEDQGGEVRVTFYTNPDLGWKVTGSP